MRRRLAAVALLALGALIGVAAPASAGDDDAAVNAGGVVVDETDAGALVAAAVTAFRDAAATEAVEARRAAFRAAAQLHERALASGLRNGALEYNAGNAWFLSGDHGRAILHYRRALLVRPGDPRVIANLDVVRGRRRDQIEAASGRAVLETIVFWHRGLSLPGKVPLALGTWAAAFLLLSLAVWLPRGATGRAGARRTGLALLFVSLLVGVSAAVELSEQGARDAAVVLADEVELRTGDGQSYPPRYENPIHSGTELRVREERAGWAEVELPDGKRGWLPLDVIERV